MMSTSFTYFYERSQIQPTIHMILQKIYYQNSMQQQCEQPKHHLDFVIFDDYITVTIKEDDSDSHTFLIDTFFEYFTILKCID